MFRAWHSSYTKDALNTLFIYWVITSRSWFLVACSLTSLTNITLFPHPLRGISTLPNMRCCTKSWRINSFKHCFQCLFSTNPNPTPHQLLWKIPPPQPKLAQYYACIKLWIFSVCSFLGIDYLFINSSFFTPRKISQNISYPNLVQIILTVILINLIFL